MAEQCPDAVMLQYVNPMAINCWAIRERFPDIQTVGLCHSVPNTVFELTHDLDIPIADVRYRVAGINHVAFFLNFERRMADGGWRDLYPDLRRQYAEGLIPKENPVRSRCPNLVRYEMMNQLGYFLTESSEHFAEYCPWFIKDGRDDLIEQYGIPLDEYPTRCEEQIAEWRAQFAELKGGAGVDVESSNEYAAVIMNAMVTNSPASIYGNVTNNGAISNLPDDCIVELPCMVDANGIQATYIGAMPPQLAAMMKTNINVQELTVAALTEENREHIFHAAMFDPHTAAELDVHQIRAMTDDLLKPIATGCRDGRSDPPPARCLLFSGTLGPGRLAGRCRRDACAGHRFCSHRGIFLGGDRTRTRHHTAGLDAGQSRPATHPRHQGGTLHPNRDPAKMAGRQHAGHAGHRPQRAASQLRIPPALQLCAYGLSSRGGAHHPPYRRSVWHPSGRHRLADGQRIWLSQHNLVLWPCRSGRIS